MDGGAWQATVHGVAKSWTRLSKGWHVDEDPRTHVEMTYQLENQALWMKEPQGSYLDSLFLKEYPNYLCNRIES